MSKLNVAYKATPTGAQNVLINADRPDTNLLVAGLAGSEVAKLQVLKVAGEGDGQLDTDASWADVYVDGSAFEFSATENLQNLQGVGVYRVRITGATAGEVTVGTFKRNF